MEFTYFIGIDVSKNELDFAVMQGKLFLFHKETPNTPEAVKALLKELGQLCGFELSKAVFCMEHTGIYNNHLLASLHKKQANICLEAASQIKNSMGNVRGKNDKVDAIRIADYAYRNREALRLWRPKREAVQRLAYLSTTRSRLLNAQKLLKMPLREAHGFVDQGILKQSGKVCSQSMKALRSDLEQVEAAIDQVIQEDAELNRLFGIITSVTGVGKVTATQIVITTNEFRDIRDPKRFACYSGVAPFVRESGLMKGKARVSNMANKTVKTLLHMSALVAVGYNEDLKRFYQRKVGEGKNKMSAINAVRNKLILRIFACVNQNRKYDKNYASTLV